MSWRYRAHKKSRATQNAARKGLERIIHLNFPFYIKLFFSQTFLQGRRPCNPAKGVPPFESPPKGLRAQDAAVKAQNNFLDSSSRD